MTPIGTNLDPTMSFQGSNKKTTLIVVPEGTPAITYEANGKVHCERQQAKAFWVEPGNVAIVVDEDGNDYYRIQLIYNVSYDKWVEAWYPYHDIVIKDNGNVA